MDIGTISITLFFVGIFLLFHFTDKNRLKKLNKKYSEVFENQEDETEKKIERLKKWWINKKVMSVSNEYQGNPGAPSLQIGTVVDIIPITQSNNPVPIVKLEGYEEPVMTFATIMEYDEIVFNALKKLTAEERWNTLIAFTTRFNER